MKRAGLESSAPIDFFLHHDILRHHIFESILGRDSKTLTICRLVCSLWESLISFPMVRVQDCQDMGQLDRILDRCLSVRVYENQAAVVFASIGTRSRICALEMHRSSPQSYHIDALGTGSPFLQTLTVSDCKFNSECLQSFCNAVASNSLRLTQLELLHCDLPESACSALFTMLSTNSRLKHIDLVKLPPAFTWAESFHEVISSKNTTLSFLGVSDCDLGLLDNVGEYLNDIIRINTNIRSLKLSAARFYETKLSELFDYVQASKTLTHLDISENDFGFCGIFGLAQMLEEHNPPLTHLDISYGTNDSDSMEYIFDALGKNTILRSIVLRGIRVGDDESSMQALLSCITKNTTLRRLHLGSIGLQSAAACLLAAAIVKNTTLRHLDLRWNSVGEDGSVALGNSLQKMTDLRCINLKENFIPSYSRLEALEDPRLRLSYYTSDDSDNE